MCASPSRSVAAVVPVAVCPRTRQFCLGEEEGEEDALVQLCEENKMVLSGSGGSGDASPFESLQRLMHNITATPIAMPHEIKL